jgi:hypothetical protein
MIQYCCGWLDACDQGVVLDTLSRIAADGFDRSLLEATMNTFEFSLRKHSAACNLLQPLMSMSSRASMGRVCELRELCTGENNTGSMPRGLVHMLRTTAAWVHSDVASDEGQVMSAQHS